MQYIITVSIYRQLDLTLLVVLAALDTWQEWLALCTT